MSRYFLWTVSAKLGTKWSHGHALQFILFTPMVNGWTCTELATQMHVLKHEQNQRNRIPFSLPNEANFNLLLIGPNCCPWTCLKNQIEVHMLQVLDAHEASPLQSFREVLSIPYSSKSTWQRGQCWEEMPLHWFCPEMVQEMSLRHQHPWELMFPGVLFH